MNYMYKMLDLQDKFNEQTTPNWKSKNLDWQTAILLESAEAIDSLDWKWWKSNKDDLNNFKVEIIDIWHFHMSLSLEVYDKEYLADKFMLLNYSCSERHNLIKLVKLYMYHIQQHCYYNSEINYDYASNTLFTIMKKIGICSHKDLYKLYLTKNCLNIIRQKNGYKTGEYLKIWNGKEDNVVAFEIADKYIDAENALDLLLEAIQEFYNNMKSQI